jgi:hypothetical protein
MDTNHNASASKDRTNLFMGKPAFVPTEKTGELIAQWCDQGEEAFQVIKPGSDWYNKVEQCITQKELVDLYLKNKSDVDANPLLQQLIANRRNQVNGKTTIAT